MSSINNSVIICESPNPAKDSLSSNAVMNYRKRLRSSVNSRSLIETPYESPLSHFKRNLNTIRETNDDIGDISVVSTPPAKKQKTKNENCRELFNLDESVVIVEDYRPTPAVENRLATLVSDTEENDVIEVPEKNIVRNLASSPGKKKPKVKAGKKAKSPINQNKLRKQKKQKQKSPKKKLIKPKSPKNKNSAQTYANSLLINDENHNGQIMGNRTNEDAVATASDTEEIEVIWSSGPNAEPANTVVTPKRAKATPQDPIIIDVAPTMANECFNEYLPRLLTSTRSHDYNDDAHKSRLPKKRKKSQEKSATGRLREIVIDGLNVAMGHSRNKVFSEKGLQIVIDYFKSRGHAVKVFLPQSSRARGRDLIEKLYVQGIVVFTPSRTIAGRKITPYDDRYILEYATQCDGIVISSDQFRDLWLEKPQWRNTIENRLLAPTFVGDYLMFPEDPLGRAGPKLEQFLRC